MSGMRTPAQRRKSQLKLKFSMTVEEYDAMLARQGGVCGICRKPPKRRHLAVDHDHDTGRIRGLLCIVCNMRLEWGYAFRVAIEEWVG